MGLLAACLLGFISIVAVSQPTFASPEKSPATSLGVIKPDDLGIIRVFHGGPLPHGHTLHFLYIIQLRIYKLTVRSRGDAKLPRLEIPYVNTQANLKCEISPLESVHGEVLNHMTLGSSFYSIYWILQTMFHPQHPEDGSSN